MYTFLASSRSTAPASTPSATRAGKKGLSMFNFRLLVLLLALLLPSAACNFVPESNDSTDGDDDDDAGGDDDDDSIGSDPVTVTITQLMAGEVPLDSPVIVEGATITTPVWISDDEDVNESRFWIQDGTGPGTGIMVFTYIDVGEMLVETLSTGTIVTVSGTFQQYDAFYEIRITSDTAVEITGQGSTPEPQVVAAAEIANGEADASLVGTLVSIEGATVTLGPSFESWYAWQADSVWIDDLFHYADVQADYAVSSVSGVLHMTYDGTSGNNDRATILPRWGSDVDFDYPGCDDSWTGNDNLQALNCQALGSGDAVAVADLVVASADTRYSGTGFYVVDPTAFAYGGVVVYSSEDIADIPVVGTTVAISGSYKEYKGNSEIVITSAADITAGAAGSAPTAIEVTNPCTLNESHEGMVVQVPSLTVVDQSSHASSNGYFEVDGCSNIHVGSDLFASADAFNSEAGGPGTVEGLRGVVAGYYNVLTINPASASDWTAWSGD